jgi:hypothetical protein
MKSCWDASEAPNWTGYEHSWRQQCSKYSPEVVGTWAAELVRQSRSTHARRIWIQLKGGASITSEVVWTCCRTSCVVLPQLSSAFFRLFVGLFVTANAVIDVTVRKMINNIAPLHTFQIKKNYPNPCSQSWNIQRITCGFFEWLQKPRNGLPGLCDQLVAQSFRPNK